MQSQQPELNQQNLQHRMVSEIIKLLGLAFFLIFCEAISVADTSIQLSLGGSRTIRFTQAAEKIVNLTPEILQVSSLHEDTRMRVHAIREGTGEVEVFSKKEKGQISARKFKILVTPKSESMKGIKKSSSDSQGQNLRNQTDPEQISSWFKKNFNSLRSLAIEEHFIISGHLESLEEYQRLEQMLFKSNLNCIPQYSISASTADSIIRYINKRLSRESSGSVALSRDKETFFLLSNNTKSDGFAKISDHLSNSLPNFQTHLNFHAHDLVQVKVTFHFVESSQTHISDSGQKITGIHFPLAGAISGGGIEQVPFQYYLKYLNQKLSTRVLEQPELLTHSGQKAELHSGGDLAYEHSLSQRTKETRYRPYGLTAKVLPETKIDGSILLNIELEISEPHTDSSSQSEASLTTRKINTNVTVEDGMSLLVARLKRKKQDDSKASPPLLGNIPLISWALTNKTMQSEEAEIWVFVSASSSLYQSFQDQSQNLESLIKENSNVLHH